ncbi:hypothetical protein [Micromonospora rosaria]|nr:hypothetical protein [Micromonospora rosaria]
MTGQDRDRTAPREPLPETDDPPPPAGSRRPGKPLIAGAVLVAAAVAATGVLWLRADPPADAPTAEGPGAAAPPAAPAPGSGPAVEAPTGESPTGAPVDGAAPSGQPTAVALPAIPGSTIDEITAGWTKRFGTTPQAQDRHYSAQATLPGYDQPVRLGLVSGTDDGDNGPTSVYCSTHDDPPLRVDRKLIRALLDSCLAPALADGEQEALTGWLARQDYSADVYATRGFDRFNAEVVSAGGALQVQVQAKGRTGPGAVRVAGAGSAG